MLQSKKKNPNLSGGFRTLAKLEVTKPERLLGGGHEVVDVGIGHGRRAGVDQLQD